MFRVLSQYTDNCSRFNDLEKNPHYTTKTTPKFSKSTVLDYLHFANFCVSLFCDTVTYFNTSLSELTRTFNIIKKCHYEQLKPLFHI